MGVGAIVLGVSGFVCMFLGVLLTPVPFAGTLVSFLAPIISLAGIVMGGVAMSRAREMGESDGTALAGVIVSSVAFVPAMLVALTCGLCNTMCTGIWMTPADPNGTTWSWLDAGTRSPDPIQQLFMVDAGTPQGAPPPAFPPPPIDPTQSAGTGADPGAGTGTDPGAGAGSGSDPGSGSGAGAGADPGSGSDPGSGADRGSGSGSGSGAGSDPGSDPGSGSGSAQQGSSDGPPVLPPPPLPAGPQGR